MGNKKTAKPRLAQKQKYCKETDSYNLLAKSLSLNPKAKIQFMIMLTHPYIHLDILLVYHIVCQLSHLDIKYFRSLVKTYIIFIQQCLQYNFHCKTRL